MKLLAFADLHGNISGMRKITALALKNRPDIIIAAGDFTVFESHIQQVFYWLASLRAPVYVIHGNHETEEITKMLCKRHKMVFAHNRLVRLGDTVLLFHGGGGFAMRDRQFQKLWKIHKKAIASAKKAVLVTHAPPFGTVLDKVYGHVGNRDYRDFILKTKNCCLAISGHIHESSGKSQKLGKALIMNPGPFGKVITL